MKPLFAFLLLGLMAAGCTTTGGAAGTGTPSAIVGPTWTLTALGANRPTGTEAAITFGTDGRVNGSTGCNSFFGTYTLSPTGALRITQVGATRMACPIGADQEARFLEAINTANRATVEGNRLMLISGSDQLLTFESAGTASAQLSGTVAYRERIALPPNAMLKVQLLDVSRADAASTTIAETIIPTSGRQVPIPFTLAYDPARIEARNRYVVRATIGDAAGVTLFTTDTAYPVVTNGAATSGLQLMLVQGQGGAVGSMGTSSLAGTSWRLVEIAATSGVALTFDGTAPYTLMFNADGTASGQVDCNRFSGPFTATSAGSLTFGATAATLAACPQPTASGDFFSVFNTVNGYRLDAGRLMISGPSGTLTFTR